VIFFQASAKSDTSPDSARSKAEARAPAATGADS